jgi:hypothetical protein
MTPDTFLIVLDTADSPELPPKVCELFTGPAVALYSRAGDLWNQYAAHMPDRGYRLRVRQVLTAQGKLSRIVHEIAG